MTVLLQRYSETGRIGREEQVVYQHCLLERIPVLYFDEKNLEYVLSNAERISMVVGSVESVTRALTFLGVKTPTPDYYPTSLDGYMFRKIRSLTVGELVTRLEDGGSIFAKPENEWKTFTGQVFTKGDTLLTTLHPSLSVHTSTVVDFLYEFRVYVKDWGIQAICQYTGDLDYEIPLAPLMASINKLKSENGRCGTFAMDWGILSDGRVSLVEMNGSFAIGCYKGISPSKYFNFLITGWNEMLKRGSSVK